MLDKLRVVLANMPQILKLILRDLVNRQPDMAIVGEVRMPGRLSSTALSAAAEAVILTLSPPSVGQPVCRALRERHPAITLLGVDARSGRAAVWYPGEAPRPIELSTVGILTALRDSRTRDLRQS